MATLDRKEFERRYPGGSYDGYVAGEEAAARFYRRPPAEVSRDLAAQNAEYKALGFSCD